MRGDNLNRFVHCVVAAVAVVAFLSSAGVRADLFIAAAAGGLWANAPSWVNNAVPTSTDSAIIPAGVAMTYGPAVTIASLEMQGGGATLTSATTNSVSITQSLNLTGEGRNAINVGFTGQLSTGIVRVNESVNFQLTSAGGSLLAGLIGLYDAPDGESTRGGNITLDTGGGPITIGQINMTEFTIISAATTVQISAASAPIDITILKKDMVVGSVVVAVTSNPAGRVSIGRVEVNDLATTDQLSLSFSGASANPVLVGEAFVGAGTLRFVMSSRSVVIPGSVFIGNGGWLALSNPTDLTVGGDFVIGMFRCQAATGTLTLTYASPLPPRSAVSGVQLYFCPCFDAVSGAGATVNISSVFMLSSNSLTIIARHAVPPPRLTVALLENASRRLTIRNFCSEPLPFELTTVATAGTGGVTLIGPGNFTFKTVNWNGPASLTLNDTTVVTAYSIPRLPALTVLFGATIELQAGAAIAVAGTFLASLASFAAPQRPVSVRVSEGGGAFSWNGTVTLNTALHLIRSDTATTAHFTFNQLPPSAHDVVAVDYSSGVSLQVTVLSTAGSAAINTGRLVLSAPNGGGWNDLVCPPVMNRTVVVASGYATLTNPRGFGRDFIVYGGAFVQVQAYTQALIVSGTCTIYGWTAGSATLLMFGPSVSCGSTAMIGTDPLYRTLTINAVCTSTNSFDFGAWNLTDVDLSLTCALDHTVAFGSSGAITALGRSTIELTDNNVYYAQPVITPTPGDSILFSIVVGTLTSVRFADILGAGNVGVYVLPANVPPTLTFDAVSATSGVLYVVGNARVAMPPVVSKTFNVTGFAHIEFLTSPISFVNPLAMAWSGLTMTFTNPAAAEIIVLGRLVVDVFDVTFGEAARIWSIDELQLVANVNSQTRVTVRTPLLEVGTVLAPLHSDSYILSLASNVTDVYVRRSTAACVLEFERTGDGTALHIATGATFSARRVALNGADPVLPIHAQNSNVTFDTLQWTSTAPHMVLNTADATVTFVVRGVVYQAAPPVAPSTFTLDINSTSIVPIEVLTGAWTNAEFVNLMFRAVSGGTATRANMRWTQTSAPELSFNGTLLSHGTLAFPTFFYAGSVELQARKWTVSNFNFVGSRNLSLVIAECSFYSPSVRVKLTGSGHITCQKFLALSGIVKLSFDADPLGRSGFTVSNAGIGDFDTSAATFQITVNGVSGAIALNTGPHTSTTYTFFTAPAATTALAIVWRLDALSATRIDLTRTGSGLPTLHFVGGFLDPTPPSINLVQIQCGAAAVRFTNLQFTGAGSVNGTNGAVTFDGKSYLGTDPQVTGYGMTLHLYDVSIDAGGNGNLLFPDAGTIICHGGTVWNAITTSTYYVWHASTQMISTSGVTTINGAYGQGMTFPYAVFSGSAVLHLIDGTAVILAGSVTTVTYDTVTETTASVLWFSGPTSGMPPLSTVRPIRNNMTLPASERLIVVLEAGATVGAGCVFVNISEIRAVDGVIGAGVTLEPVDAFIRVSYNGTILGPPLKSIGFQVSGGSQAQFGPGVYHFEYIEMVTPSLLYGGPNVVLLAAAYAIEFQGSGDGITFDGGFQLHTPWFVPQLIVGPDSGHFSLLSGSFLNITDRFQLMCSGCGGDASNWNLTFRSNSSIAHYGAGSPAVAWNFDDFIGGAPPHIEIKTCLYTPYNAPPPFVRVLPPESGLPCVYPPYDGCSLGLCGAFSCTNSNNPQNVTCGTGCGAGFTGSTCQTNIDDCASGPCTAPDTCVDGINSYTCVPPPNPCISSPCQNGGTCLNAGNAFTCLCALSLWTGATCSTPIAPVSPCASVTCHHGGTCVVGSGNTASCTCASPYWTGSRCDVWVDPCVVNPCFFSKTCQNGGLNSTSFQCVCLVAACGAGTTPEAVQTAAQRDAVVPALVSLTPSSAPSIGGVRMVLTTRGFTGTFVLRMSLQPPGSSAGAGNTSISQHFRTFAGDESGFALSDAIPFNFTPDASVEEYFRQFKLSFFAPPYAVSKSAYRSIVLSVTPDDGGATAPFVLRSDSLLYIPFNPCLDAGVSLAYANGVPFCDSCPHGGYCPGGGRIWPVAGFWSSSEYATPIECPVPEACPGTGDGERRTNADGSTITSRCAEGYTGHACSQCQSSYYQSGLRCFSCGSSQSDTQQLQFLIAAAIIIFVALSIAVATLSSRWLALVVTCLIAVQQFVTIGKSAVQRLPASADPLVQLLSFLSVVNFDVQMVKPGCIVPQLTFLSLYWTTIILVAVSTSFFAVGAAARATWVYHFRLKNRTPVDVIAGKQAVAPPSGETDAATASPAPAPAPAVALEVDSSAAASPKSAGSLMTGRSGAHTKRYDTVTESGGTLTTDERDWASTWCDVFTARLIQSLLILGTLMFLKIFTLCLQCANCEQLSGVEADESGAGAETTLRLVIDPTQVCYSGPHASAIVFDYFVLIIYGAGFPALSFFLLYRTFRSRTATALLSTADASERRRLDAKAADHYGYLYRGLIPAAWYFRLFTFLTTWGFGLQLVFARSIHVQVFVPGVFFLVNVTLVGQLWPYTNNFNNLLSVAVGFGGAFQVMVYLGVLGNSNPSNRSSIYVFLYWMAALTATSMAVFAYARYRKRHQKVVADSNTAAGTTAATGAGTVYLQSPDSPPVAAN